MTGYQMSVFFGTPLVLAIFAWGLVGLHRLMPRPQIPAHAVGRENHTNGQGRAGGLHREIEPNYRASNARKVRKPV
jgi:hypothetical protein